MSIHKLGSSFILISIFFLHLLEAGDAENALKQARRYFGNESALESVKSIHFSGYVIAEDSREKAELNFVLQKPYLSWMQIKRGNVEEVVVANKIEGFVVRKHLESGKSRVEVLPAKAAARLNNMAWFRLHFFDLPQKRFGKAKSEGLVDMEGRLCNKVKVNFPGEAWAAFYFDKDTGRHLVTHSDNGLRLVKTGEIIVNGIRFPQKVTVFEQGREVRRMIFEKIAVNQAVDSRIFEFPSDS